MEIINFEFNNWFSGRDYPIGEKYSKLINDYQFNSEDWAKENKLVVVVGPIDMSLNWCISAPKKWVEENLPELLSDVEYTYKTILYSNGENKEIVHTKKYSDFIRHRNEDGELIGRFNMPFKEYSEENIGVHWISEDDY